MEKLNQTIYYPEDSTIAKITSTYIDREALEEFSTSYPEVDVSPWQEEKWRNNSGCGAYSLVLKNVMQHWDRIWEKESKPTTPGVLLLTPQMVMWIRLSDILIKCIREKMEEAIKLDLAPPGTPPQLLPDKWKDGIGRNWPTRGQDGTSPSRGISQYETVLWVLPCKNKLMKDRYGITDGGGVQPGLPSWGPTMIREARNIGWPLVNTRDRWPPKCTCPPIKPITIFIASPLLPDMSRPGQWMPRFAHAVNIMPTACIKPGKTTTSPAWEIPAQLPGTATTSPPAPPPALIGPPTYHLTIDSSGKITRVRENPLLEVPLQGLKGWSVQYLIC